ncbi:MAG: uncharacterized protein QOG96_1482 [Pseudonocardiales bacterium]|nr:uncharacterized protein [Pseudonocardiales bacterium]
MSGHGPGALTRRAVLASLGLTALGLTAAGCGQRGYTGPARTVTIAAGEPGGFYIEFAELLAAEITDEEPRLRAVAVPTEGSLDNVGLLADGKADLALVLADAAQATATTGGPLPTPVPMLAIGRVYENYLQLVVLADSPVHRLTDLAGRTASLGAHGSGAELIGDRLLAAAGLSAAGPTAAGPSATVPTATVPTATAGVTVQHRLLADATAALERAQIAALLWSGGVPTPALAALAGRRPIRLLALDSVIPALRSAYGPVYEPTAVPADAYGPAAGVATIGVANLLVCHPDADPALTATVARVLVTHAARLVPEQALGTQFLDPRNLIVTAGIPLHPGAVAAYRDLHG